MRRESLNHEHAVAKMSNLHVDEDISTSHFNQRLSWLTVACQTTVQFISNQVQARLNETDRQRYRTGI